MLLSLWPTSPSLWPTSPSLWPTSPSLWPASPSLWPASPSPWPASPSLWPAASPSLWPASPSATPTVVQAVSLFEGLHNANATKFAQWIQSDPDLTAIFTNTSVKTIFAPIDSAFENGNKTYSSRSLLHRQTSRMEALQQCSDTETDLAAIRVPHGDNVPTKLPADGGRNQPVVAHNNTAKMLEGTGTTGIQLFSGLGNNVTVLKGDTVYDGGRIQMIDGFFTIPQSLTSTLAAKNLTSFAAGIQATNLTSIVSNHSAAGVTVFAPSNAAYAAAGLSPNISSLTETLSNHIITGFLGYLPSLNDGAILTTHSGMTVMVHIQGEDYFIDDAKIVAGDLVTSNGVAHIIDKVITPASQTFTGAAERPLSQISSTVTVVWSVAISLLFAWLMS